MHDRSFPLGGAVLFPSAFLIFALASAANAGTITVVAAHDNFVRGDSAEANTVQNYNGTITIKRASGLNTTRKGWIKFDLSSYAVDATQPATFTFWNVGTSSTWTGQVGVFGLNAGFVPGPGILGTDWAESQITWNNAPGNSTGSVTALTNATKIGANVLIGNQLTAPSYANDPAGTSYSVTIPQLSAFLQNDDTVTIMLVVQSQTDSNPTLNIASKEHASISGPTLTFSLVPEPSSLVLAGFALAALAAGAMRRHWQRRTVREA